MNEFKWSKKVISALLIVAVVFIPASLASGIDRYDLNLYEYRQVTEKGRGSLVFQESPRGSSIKGFKYHDGDWVYVNVKWRQDGYTMAYENGTYGYVDASYFDWGYTKSTPKPLNPSIPQYPDEMSSNWQWDYIGDCYVVNCNEWVSLREHADTSSIRLEKVPLGARVTDCYDTAFDLYLCEYRGQIGFILKRYLSTNHPMPTKKPKHIDRVNLNLYEYRQVASKGRGSLIFQKVPRGSFMKDFKYCDGDWIYVNVKWRSEGYAMAYENGTYGYVDASYIDW